MSRETEVPRVRSLAALIIALVSVLAVAAAAASSRWYLGLQAEREIAGMDAKVQAVQRFLDTGRGHALDVIWARHYACYPTMADWFWRRMRASRETVEKAAFGPYLSCLAQYAQPDLPLRRYKLPTDGI
jgi:hypothetical protein